MKVAIVTFEISKIGGIATHAWELFKVLQQHGVDVEQVYLKHSYSTQKALYNNMKTKKSTFKLGGTQLSLSKKTLKQTLYYLDQFDILFFTHACIHEEDSNWLDVYKLGKTNLVCISDIYWNKFYPYYDKVIPYVTKFYPTNAAVKNYLKKNKNINGEVIVHPFDYPEHKLDISKKQETMVWAHQWRNWKGIDDLCEIIPQLNCKLLMFGSGRSYSEWRERLAKMPNVEYLGNQPPEQIIQAYKDSKYSIDLTGRSPEYYGHHNRTTIEPMFFHCLSICYESLIEPHSHIPIPTCVGLERDKGQMIKDINELIERKELWELFVNNAYEWVREWYDHKNVIRQVLHAHEDAIQNADIPAPQNADIPAPQNARKEKKNVLWLFD